MKIFWHYCCTLCMNSTQVCVIKQACQIILCGLSQCMDGVHLKLHVIGPLHLGDLAHQVYKGPFVGDKLCAPLVFMDFMESDHPWLVPLGPLGHPLKIPCGAFLPVVGLMWPTSPLVSMVPPPLLSAPSFPCVRILATSSLSPAPSATCPSSLTLWVRVG